MVLVAANLNWGIIGAGAIAKAFARGLANSRTGKLLAVASRDQDKADAFGKAEKIDVPRRYGSYEALLADGDVQAVYISTPHPMHAEWTIRAAQARKHILCEKPFAVNHAEAMAMVEAARLNDVLVMEAFMYRCHPQTARLVELIKQGVIGQIRLIQASFGFNAGFSAESRLFKNALAGGGILDVGCYAISMARLIAGAAMGKDFAEPIEVKGSGHLVPETGVDGWAAATLKFPGEIVAQCATAVQANLENVVRIFGAEGSIFVPNPWVASREGGTSAKIIINKRGTKEPQEIAVDTPVTSFALEADAVAEGIERRHPTPPAMTSEDTLGNMKALDQWRLAIGLTYEQEKQGGIPTVHRRPLAVRTAHNMKYGRIAGLDKPISRLVMGVDNQTFLPHAAVMFDDWFERGGNCWDTAYGYGGGACERVLGQWIKARGIRDQVVIFTKGVHTPLCYPPIITVQLMESLQRLQTDHVEIYMMHRDNPQVPVGEFIDVLNEHVRAGRIGIFGGSNWSLSRIEEGNAYAKKKGLQGFSAVSNNFSLAEMIDAPWAGCVHSSDAASRAWFTTTQTPMMPWSSQARGFFIPALAHPDKKDNKEMVRCWYSADNFRRQERAIELARKHNVEPINIALAYVLCQPFPTFPLIGPRTLAETRSSLRALDIQLSEQELRWLNLEE